MGPVGVGVAEEVTVVVATVEPELVRVLVLSPVAVVLPGRVVVLLLNTGVVAVLKAAVEETVATVEVEEHGTESHPGVYLVES